METQKLAGKVALVSGASKGLGKAMATALAEAGAKLFLVSRNQQMLDEVTGELRAAGHTCDAFAADVTREEEVIAARKAFGERHVALDILINNAGINIRKPLTEFSLAEWNKVLDTNLTGAFLLCREFATLMKGRGYGRIINMTSMMSHVSLPGRSAYCASKFGLLGMTKALALELAPEGITVNGISPGPFATEMNTPLLQNPELNQQFVSRIPMGHWGAVPDIGKLAVYLCSPEAGFITGTDIVIDGGWTAQ